MDPQSGSETRIKGFYAQIKGAAFRRCAQSSHSDSYFCFKSRNLSCRQIFPASLVNPV